MPILTPLGVDARVNTITADGQVSPRIVALADGKYMVIWVGSVIQPVVPTGGTIAPAYANADIRAQIFNADGTPSGGEFIVNTTTVGGQLRPEVTQLSNGNVLVTWHDGVGPAGGSAETTPNTIRAQEFTSTGVAVGSEFVIGNSNGRMHSIAATTDGGFVVTYQEGGVGGSLAVGRYLAKIFNADNIQTAAFVVDDTQPNAGTAFVAVEPDGDIVIYFTDYYQPLNMNGALAQARYNSQGTFLESGILGFGYNIAAFAGLTTGVNAYMSFYAPGSGQPNNVYAYLNIGGSFEEEYIQIAQGTNVIGAGTITPLANGGFIASWHVDSDPGNGVNVEIMARAFNAVGDPMGPAFQLNTVTALNQSGAAFVQLTNGDIVAAWTDASLLNGDSSGTGISVRRIDYDPANQNPVATNFAFSQDYTLPGTSIVIDPAEITGFFGPDGVDGDGDPLVITAVGNATNGTATLNGDGTLTLFATPGATGRLSFDYTISDGQGGSATARATLTLPSDAVSLRPGETMLVDFLANDYYTPGPAATGFTVSSSITAQLVNTGSGQRIFINPLIFNGQTQPPSESFYFNLLVGQTAQATVHYGNNENNGTIFVTIEGWTQQGGTNADNLVGDARPNHLSGGTGAANTLTGGLADDWYTVMAVGDMVVEYAGEGNDSVRTQLASYTLPDHVENLYFFGQHFSGTGYGNSGNNVIAAANWASMTFYGMGGNDTLIGWLGDDILEGGEGDDILNGGGWFGGSGLDAASYTQATGAVQVDLRLTGAQNTISAGFDTLLNIESLVGSAFNDILNGNDGNNVLDGGAGANVLNGHGGSDRLLVGTGSDGSTINGGSDYDTLVATGITTSLASISGMEAIELLTGAQLTLTGSQISSGFAASSQVHGFGTLIIDMTPGLAHTSTQFNFGTIGNNSFYGNVIVNGTSGSDTIQAANVSYTIFGGGGDDNIQAGQMAQSIYGGDGNDTIQGNTYATHIDGGAGDDTITSYAQRSTIHGGAGENDAVNYSGNRGNYYIDTVTIDGTSYVRVKTYYYDIGDLLTGVEYLQFADQRVYIGPNNRPTIGPSPIADQVMPDNMEWSFQLPADAFVDSDNNILTYSATQSDGYQLPHWLRFDAATRTFSGLANWATAGQTFSIRVRATDNHPADPGSYAEDVFILTIGLGPGTDIYGTMGDDFVSGSIRTERVFALAGNDRLYGSDGADALDGGDGVDWLDYNSSSSAVTVNLASGIGLGGKRRAIPMCPSRM